MKNNALLLTLSALITVTMTSTLAQSIAEIDFQNVGRAWPLGPDLNEYHMTGKNGGRSKLILDPIVFN